MAASAEIARANGKKGGRPQGATTRLTRVKANEIVSSGYAPLDVMMKNMIFWCDKAQDVAEKIQELITDEITEDQRTDALKLLREFLNAREQAQRCAVDAAPYVHPRLQSIALHGKVDGTIAHILGTMTLQQAAEAYAATLGS